MLQRATSLVLMLILISTIQSGCAESEGLSKGPVSTTQPAFDEKGRPALAANLDEQAFKDALVGEWVPVWHSAGPDAGRFVKYMAIDPNGAASVTFVDRETEQTIKGTYSVAFRRPPARYAVTLAAIRIRPPAGEPVELRAYFDQPGSAVQTSAKIVLYIDPSIMGGAVLTRAPGR
jgi:hypothetical protein